MNNGNFQAPPGFPQYPQAPQQGGYAPQPNPGFQPPPQGAPPGYAPHGFQPPQGGFAPGPQYATPQAPPPAYGPPQGGGFTPPQGPAAPQASGRFRGAAGTQMYQSGEYFTEPGEYTLRVKDVIDKNTRQKGPAVIVVFEVLRGPGNSAGSQKSWMQHLSNAQVAFPQLLAFVAVAGFDADPANEQAVQWVNTQLSQQLETYLEELVTKKTIGGKPMIGKVVHMSATPHVTKTNQKNILRTKFSVERQP